MRSFFEFKHIKEIFLFSTPIIAGQIGQMLFGVGDILVAARYSNEVVSSLGIAVGIMAPLIMFGLGICYAITPRVAKNLGLNDKSENPKIVFTSSVGIFIIGIFLYLLLLLIGFNIEYFGYQKSIASLIQKYLFIAGISIIPSLLFQVHKEYLQAYDDIWFANVIVVLMNIINILMNFILMFGVGPFPELGIAGAAIATNVTRFVLWIIIWVYSSRKFKHQNCFDLKLLKNLFRFGLPIAFGTLIEVLVFSAVTLLIGKISIIASASHNIVLNMASLTFMIPLGISSAASVKVGLAFGKKDLNLIRSYTICCVLISCGVMLTTACFYFAIPDFLVGLTTQDKELINYASGLLFFVGLFQIPDGMQITLLGVLRGLEQTKIPMCFSFVANWIIGLPFGHYLATQMNKEASGYWAGLAMGLTMMCLFLMILFKKEFGSMKKRFIS